MKIKFYIEGKGDATLLRAMGDDNLIEVIEVLGDEEAALVVLSDYIETNYFGRIYTTFTDNIDILERYPSMGFNLRQI